MPKVKQVLKIIFYDKDNEIFAEQVIKAWSYDSLIHEYLEYVELLAKGQYTYVRRIDLVGSGHVILTFSDVRRLTVKEQINLNLIKL